MTISFVLYVVLLVIALTASIGTAYKMIIYGVRGPIILGAPFFFVITFVGVPLLLFYAVFFAPEKLDGPNHNRSKIAEVPVLKRIGLGLEVFIKIMVIFPTILGCVVSIVAEARAHSKARETEILRKNSTSRTDEVTYQVWELVAMA